MKQVLLISGKSASGKDTIANFMREELEALNNRVLIIHFADMVKFYAQTYFHWSGEKDINGRALLQRIGTDMVRAQDPDYWVDTVARFVAVLDAYNDFDVALVPDARFPNEIVEFKKYIPHIKTIRVIRYNPDGTLFFNPVFTMAQHKHSSETALDTYHEFDYIVEHSQDDLQDLRDSAHVILKDLQLLE